MSGERYGVNQRNYSCAVGCFGEDELYGVVGVEEDIAAAFGPIESAQQTGSVIVVGQDKWLDDNVVDSHSDGIRQGIV